MTMAAEQQHNDKLCWNKNAEINKSSVISCMLAIYIART